MKHNGKSLGITLVVLVALVLAACSPITPEPAPAAAATPAPTALTMDALANATYQGIYPEPVTLTDGSYEGEPFVAGGASKPTVTLIPAPVGSGDLNGDGVADAAVLLAENSGGSGTFIYLAAVLDANGAPENAATTLLGDSVQVQTLTIENAQIVVSGMTVGPDDPMCCPSQPFTQTFELQGDQLVEVTA